MSRDRNQLPQLSSTELEPRILLQSTSDPSTNQERSLLRNQPLVFDEVKEVAKAPQSLADSSVTDQATSTTDQFNADLVAPLLLEQEEESESPTDEVATEEESREDLQPSFADFFLQSLSQAVRKSPADLEPSLDPQPEATDGSLPYPSASLSAGTSSNGDFVATARSDTEEETKDPQESPLRKKLRQQVLTTLQAAGIELPPEVIDQFLTGGYTIPRSIAAEEKSTRDKVPAMLSSATESKADQLIDLLQMYIQGLPLIPQEQHALNLVGMQLGLPRQANESDSQFLHRLLHAISEPNTLAEDLRFVMALQYTLLPPPLARVVSLTPKPSSVVLSDSSSSNDNTPSPLLYQGKPVFINSSGDFTLSEQQAVRIATEDDLDLV